MRYQVVISHNQSRFVDRFSDIFGNERIVFVFDAMDEYDIRAMERNHNVNIVTVRTPGNRSANRNAGLAYVMSHFAVSDDDIVEFFDGDRFPVCYSPRELGDIDVLLYPCENDKRFEKLKPGPVSTRWVSNPFYSCGFAIKVSAIRKIEALNGGKLFKEEFREWGCEDQYLGMQCHLSGLNVVLDSRTVLAGTVGGDELSHPNYRATLQQYVDLIRANGMFPSNK